MILSQTLPIVRPTTVIEAVRLSQQLGAKITVVSETFQHTGSFKFRAAYNVVSSISQSRVITASSGNFGQAIAYACKLLNKSCVVVMPDTSAQVKIEAVRAFGGIVDLIDTAVTSRSARVAELARQDPGAYVASAYDDALVIEGNASLGREIGGLAATFDCIVAPVGGGGLTSGIIRGLQEVKRSISVVGVEPVIGNDAARSLQAGSLMTNPSEPATIADGVRTVSLGKQNWEILRDYLTGIVEVTEDQIKESVRLLFSLANLKAEPTGALSIAAILARPEEFRNRSICCVVSGGNVDPELFRAILKGP